MLPRFAIPLFCLLCVTFCPPAGAGELPNILWIVAEDASPHLGCYGETGMATPHLDRLASEGIRFDNALVSSPVCSPSRSALVTGMHPVTLGTHHHRSQRREGKGSGNSAYYSSYFLPEGFKTIPEIFRQAGYFVCNGAWKESAPWPPGKEDYNFQTQAPIYEGSDWSQRPAGKPFFAQVQLRGGKNRKARRWGTDPEAVALPPYYPDHPALRDDWAAYLDSWRQTDYEVGAIRARLEKEDLLGRTAIVFLTDHGVSHLRGKQFLYEEGIRIPLIMRFPDGRNAGSAREDLVSQIDVAATSLAMAGIAPPAYLQGQDILAVEYRRKRFVVSARDRCDETVDMIRCLRTPRFKYIRNFLPWLSHAQPNQYKDSKEIIQTLRSLHETGALNELQARPFQAFRPAEELYDLETDPFETRNLALSNQTDVQAVRTELAQALEAWMVENRDLGLIPEPILEEMGREFGSKAEVLLSEKHLDLGRQLLTLIADPLPEYQGTPMPALRWWLASSDIDGAFSRAFLEDPDPAVRVAAARQLGLAGQEETAVPVLAKLVAHENRLVGLYALSALEQLGKAARPAVLQIEGALESDCEFTRRVARRIMENLFN